MSALTAGKLLIGDWVAARSGAVEPVTSPWDGRVVGEVAVA